MSIEKRLISVSPQETISLGFEFAKRLKRSDIVGLSGNLGSGKTQFVKGICKYFNVKDQINSPTFIIVNEYSGEEKNSGKLIEINHFDLYRIKDISELREIGIDEYVNNDSICLIEWAQLAEEYFKGKLIKVLFEYGETENERVINWQSAGN